jgi:hypothetical protein
MTVTAALQAFNSARHCHVSRRQSSGLANPEMGSFAATSKSQQECSHGTFARFRTVGRICVTSLSASICIRRPRIAVALFCTFPRATQMGSFRAGESRGEPRSVPLAVGLFCKVRRSNCGAVWRNWVRRGTPIGFVGADAASATRSRDPGLRFAPNPACRMSCPNAWREDNTADLP